MAEARELGVEPVPGRGVIGRAAFPVILTDPTRDCFVAVVVERLQTGNDELPGDDAIDETARNAMREAIAAARRLRLGATGALRVLVERRFDDRIHGASCGLATTLAVISLFDGRPLVDGVAATGHVSREGLVLSVNDVGRKAALLRVARPRARLLCPAGGDLPSDVTPVSTLGEACRAAWRTDPQQLREAITAWKAGRAEARELRHLDLRGIDGISSGAHETESEVLEVLVPPRLEDEEADASDEWPALSQRLRERDLSPAERADIQSRLARLQRHAWRSGRVGTRTPTIPLLRGLLAHRRLLLIGEPGAGKSLLTRLLVLACVDGPAGRRARSLLLDGEWEQGDFASLLEELTAALPVRISLGAFGEALACDDALDLADYVAGELRMQQAPPALLDAVPLLLSAGILFLIADGVDEVAPAVRARVTAALEHLIERNPGARVVVTTRPHGYAPRIAGMNHQRIGALDFWERRQLVTRLHRLVEMRRDPGEAGVARARARTDALVHAIERSTEFDDLTSNPLLLTLVALAPPDPDGLPRHRVYVFESFIRTIAVQWAAWRRRPGLDDTKLDAEALLAVWSEVAWRIVQQDRRHGVSAHRMHRILDEVLAAKIDFAKRLDGLDAARCIELALEVGLLKRYNEEISFWHSTFGEYLAARALAGTGPGAARRILAERDLSRLVLCLAAARIHFVLDTPEEIDALFEGLLAADVGDAVIFVPGLRAASACLADGVGAAKTITAHLWHAWADHLERTTPSPAWSEFARLVEKRPPELAPVQRRRFIGMDDCGVREVRDALARIVWPAASSDEQARSDCARWLTDKAGDARRYAALGLAAGGDWSDAVIDVLGRFSDERSPKPDPRRIREVVRAAGPTLVERLRTLAAAAIADEATRWDPGSTSAAAASQAEREEAARRLDLGISSACLLVIAGCWDETIATLLRQTVAGTPSVHRNGEARAVLALCIDAPPVRTALIQWLARRDTVGRIAREIVQGAAPVVEGMAESVLTVASSGDGNDDERGELVTLLTRICAEQPGFAPRLLRCLTEDDAERRLVAACVLRRLAPDTPALHEALRRGMREGGPLLRARFAAEAQELASPFFEEAEAALVDCAASDDAAARRFALDRLRWPRTPAARTALARRAMDPAVRPRARLDLAQHAAMGAEDTKPAVAAMRMLLDVDEAEVRGETALCLLTLVTTNGLDEQIMTQAGEALARIDGRNGWAPWMELERANRFQSALLRAYFATKERMAPGPDRPVGRTRGEDPWLPRILGRFAAQDPVSLSIVMEALGAPGQVGALAATVLSHLLNEQAPAPTEAVKRALSDDRGDSPIARARLVEIAIWHQDLAGLAVVAAGRIVSNDLPQSLRLDTAQALCRVHTRAAADIAARLFEETLGGPDLLAAIECAEWLASAAPASAATWIDPIVVRALDSPDASHRLDGARLCAWIGVHLGRAEATLLDAMRSRDPRVPRPRGGGWCLCADGPPGHSCPPGLLEWEFHYAHSPRVDLKAMRIFCHLDLPRGLLRLAEWLDEDDLERFVMAADVLARNGAHVDRVRAALTIQLAQCHDDAIDRIQQIIYEHELFADEMVDRLLLRPRGEDDRYFHGWNFVAHLLRRAPGRWARIRALPVEGRHRAVRLFPAPDLPITRDAVALTVECWLAPATPEQVRQICPGAIDGFFRSSDRDGDGDHPPRPAPDSVRTWIREVLDVTPDTADLIGAIRFDEMADLAGWPVESRIRRMRSAFDPCTNVMAEDPNEHSPRLELAARLAHAGAEGDDLVAALKAAFDETQNYWMMAIHARALNRLRPLDETERRRLCEVAVTAPWYRFTPRFWFDGLESIELSIEERIAALEARLQRALDREDGLLTTPAPGSPAEAQNRALEPIFDTPLTDCIEELARLGCPLSRRITWIERFVARRDADRFPRDFERLATVPDLPPRLVARLLIQVMVTAGFHARQAAAQWDTRHGIPREKTDHYYWSIGNLPRHLASRYQDLDRLSHAPAWLDELLADTTGLSPALLDVHRRAISGDTLTGSEWAALAAALQRRTDEPGAARFAREWLCFLLWRACDPAAIAELRSP